MNLVVTVKTVPHPNPKGAIDMLARSVVKELLNIRAEKVSNDNNEDN